MNTTSVINDFYDCFVEEESIYHKIIDVLDAYLGCLSSSISSSRIEILKCYRIFCHSERAGQNKRPLSYDSFVKAIQYAITFIDKLLNQQVNLILHHARFQRLEASWLGLFSLVMSCQAGKTQKIKMLDVSWDLIARDLKYNLEFDQSVLFKKIYSGEFDRPGGEPFGLLIGDYFISHNGFSKEGISHLETLEGLSKVAASAFAPIILSCHPGLFGLDSFSEFRPWLDFQKIFQEMEYSQFRKLRQEDDMRFVGLLCPRCILRQPYQKYRGTGSFYFTESIQKHEDYLWGNAIYSLATIVLREFYQSRWFTEICGVKRGFESQGLVTNLFKTSFNLDNASVLLKPLLETQISATTGAILNEFGFIALCECDHTSYAVFYSVPSLNQPMNYDAQDVANNAKLSSQLNNILNVSRFAHYIKLIIRNKIGSFISPRECEIFLSNWLINYTSELDEHNSASRSKYPLQKYNIQLKEQPGMPGNYICIIHLRPHFCVGSFSFDLLIASNIRFSYESK